MAGGRQPADVPRLAKRKTAHRKPRRRKGRAGDRRRTWTNADRTARIAGRWAAQNSTYGERANDTVFVATLRPRRHRVGGANDWPLQPQRSRVIAPTGPAPVERMIVRAGRGSGQSFRPPAQGRWSDVELCKPSVVANRLSTGTGPVEQQAPPTRNKNRTKLSRRFPETTQVLRAQRGANSSRKGPPTMQFRLSTLFLLFVVLWSTLAVFGTLGVLAFAILLLLAIAVARSWMVLFWSVALLVLVAAALLPAMANCRPVARRVQCTNNLKQIALALYDYEKANGCYPPAYIADKNGRPMHSWRVLILPYLGYGSLYKRYSFNEPWNGPNNKKLLAARPREYVCPSDGNAWWSDAGPTSYVAVVGRNAAWRGTTPRKAVDLAPSHETIIVVEVAESGISWTEPKDLSVRRRSDS